MGRFLRRYVFFLAVAALTFAAGYAFAQALPVPVNIQPVGPAPGGLSTMVTFDARGVGGASNAGYYTRPVLVSNNTLGGLARGLLRRSVPVAAMAALIEAAGWAIDELTQQVMVPGQPSQDLANTVWCGAPFGSTTIGCANSPEALGAALAPRSTGPSAPYTFSHWNGSNRLYFCGAGGGCGASIAISTHSVPDPASFPYPNWNPGTAPQPVPDSALGELVRNNPHVWNDALRNADGSVNRNPDVMAEAQRLADALTNPDPVTNPAPDPAEEWDSGYQGGEPQPNAGQEPVPAFCEWASVICDWLDWTQEEPIWEDDDDGLPLPVVDPLEDAPTFNPGLGSGSCPAPQEVSTFVGTISIPFDTFCGLASALYPLVIAAAYLTGAFIIVGVRRG